jgi:hypothetical protein
MKQLIHGSSFLFFFPATWISVAGPEETKNPAGKEVLRLIQIRLATPSLAKISPTRQTNSPQQRITDSSSKNAVSFSSARTHAQRNAFRLRDARQQSGLFAHSNSSLIRIPSSNRLC